MSLVEIKQEPSRRDLAWFGALLPVAVGALGLAVRRQLGSTTGASVVWACGGGIAALYLLLPAVRRPIFVGWSLLAAPIGWLVSHAILAVAFYAVVTPIGLLGRIAGRDPLQRRLDRSAKTYWVERAPGQDVGRYFRQF